MLRGNVSVLQDAYNKLVESTQIVNNYDTTDLFHAMMEILKTNKEMKEYLDQSTSTGIDAIYLIKFMPDKTSGKKSIYKPLDTKLQNSSECVSMFSKYISTTLNLNYDNLKEAIKVKNYIDNECWINTIMDFYGDTVLSHEKSLRYRITRPKLLEILNVSEDTITQGLSIKDVVPFFEKFKLQLKVFNESGKLIFKYIPENPNKNEKYAMLNSKETTFTPSTTIKKSYD